MKIQTLPFLILCLLTSLSSPSVAELEELSEWLEAERERWNIPGLAVAVVQDDELKFAEGFGHLRLDRQRAVDGETQFGIASLSKAMTATALAMMVDEGKLDWDDRVIDHLPEFALSDAWVTSQVTVRDLLSHRVGVGRLFGNRLTFMPAASRQDFVARLRHHEFEQPFRQGYVYSNGMYTVAGELLERLSGQPWEAFIEDRLFQPLGMQRSRARLDGLDDNAVWPHQEINGELVEIERRDWGFGGPAAAVNASMVDLASWMRFNLGVPGVLDGERLVSASVMEQLHRPANLIGFDEDELNINAYGLGWSLARYRGLHVLRHGGATDGINTQIWLVPELDLGIVASANRFSRLLVPIMKEVIDRLAGHDSEDWANQAYQDWQESLAEALEERQAVHDARQLDTSPSRDLAAYVGNYVHALYDQVEVFESESELMIRFWQDESQTARLAHWHFDTFRAVWRNPAQREKFVWFGLDEHGEPDSLKVRFTLRPTLLEAGTYPADYTRDVHFTKK
jgi:CubicO group peptidase (beta-lactamase class C family)